MQRRVDLGDPQAGQFGLGLQRVLEVDHHLHQGRPARVALRPQDVDQPLEGHLLVGERVEHGGADVAEEVGEGPRLVHLRAQHHGVAEVADEALQFDPAAARGHRAHRDVLLPRVAGEHQLARGHQGHEQRGAGARAEFGQPPGQLLGHGDLVDRARGAEHRGPRAVRGQLHRGQPGQLLAPVVELPRHLRPGEAFLLPGRVVRVLHREVRQFGRLAAHPGRVPGVELLDQEPDGPAVADDVVQAQHQHVLVRGEPQQRHPEQRAAAQVERGGRLALQAAAEFGAALGLRQAGEVDDLDGHASGLVHHLGAAALDLADGGAQRLVPGDHGVQGRAQRLDVQVAGQPQHPRGVVLDAARVQFGQEPQPLLARRQGQPAVPGHRGDRALLGNGLGLTGELAQEELPQVVGQCRQLVLRGGWQFHAVLFSPHSQARVRRVFRTGLRPSPAPWPGSGRGWSWPGRRSSAPRRGPGG